MNKYTLLYIVASMTLAGCSDDFFDGGANNNSGDRIQLSGEIDQLAVTRVNDNGFCDGDEMGTYIVDYDGDQPGVLKVSGNRADNLKQTFNEEAYSWTSAYDVYWKDKHTAIDVYGYYPFASPSSVEAYAFTVQRDQSTVSTNGTMGGYEASDFLWGKVENVAPTTNVIRLPLAHRMANARVTLVEGSGFASGEWAKTDKTVLVANVIREATINMSTGTVTATGSVESTATMPSNTGDEWRAIVVPQTVSAGTTLFSITIGGVPYKFKKQEDFTYTAGKMSNFGIKVDKKAESGQYQLTLISESITPWENDLVSHDATMKEYIVINSTAGHLKDSIAAASKDYTQVKNLKVTGEINNEDYDFMRNDMTNLQSLNLKDVLSIYSVENGDTIYGIPHGAMQGKTSLVRIVLPDRLSIIGDAAFVDCTSLTGSLIVPEGVTSIGTDAFYDCKFLTGSLSLPSTLESIGGGAFAECGFVSEIVLPNSLKSIGNSAFYDCTSLYGNLILPDGLTDIGSSAFYNCFNITGSLTIPQGIKDIPNNCFQASGFNGTLQLHDGIRTIGRYAFWACGFRGQLILPKNLTTIGEYTFSGNSFSGKLELPDGLINIGEGAFNNCSRLTGTIEFPEEMQSIGIGAFSQCSMIEGLTFPASLENIKDEAFAYCYDIGSIVCKGTMPAHLGGSVFNGVAKDNFTLEVPETAINDYKTSTGWADFKRIAAHHELVCRPSTACALNTEHQQTLIVDAEGEWEVESMPDWCELSQTSGNKKTEVTLTIKQMAKGSEDRTGDIVFKLKDLEYTHKCTVSQYDYDYGEDEVLTLQKATKGNNGGIDIVILGDGYDAKNISDGDYLTNMKQEMEYFFAIEPYKTYRDYFNVYTAFPLSNESGVGTVNTICYNRFNTTYTGGVGLKCDYDEVFSYALKAPTITKSNLYKALIIMVPNSTDYGGITQMWQDGSAIAFCPMSDYDYPLDARGVIQHEAGGHGFGKLGDEYIYHNAFIDACGCSCCGHTSAIESAKALGWYDNLSLTGKMHEVPWSHFIFHEKYSNRVDVYEGGYMHTRGVFRSEQTSCMNNNIPYFSAISRESIVKRIKRYAGETYSFSDFVANDVLDAATVETTRSAGTSSSRNVRSHHMPPTIHKGSPLKGMRMKVYKHK